MSEMKVQAILENDLAEIRTFHQRRLGWAYLLEETVADRAVGFPCENEEFAIRRQLRTAAQQVSDWFKRMGRTNNWPSVQGWMWEIDFNAAKAVPKKQNAAEQIESDPALLVEGPIMDLGDMDVDVIRRLLETRNTRADLVRSSLRRVLGGEMAIDDLQGLAEQLGEADKDVRDWFEGMAQRYKWPRSRDNSWFYRVETREQKAYLARRSNMG